jgi:hypothetical protein
VTATDEQVFRAPLVEIGPIEEYGTGYRIIVRAFSPSPSQNSGRFSTEEVLSVSEEDVRERALRASRLMRLKPANRDFLRKIQYLSYETAERLSREGFLSADDWQRYCRIWDWSATHIRHAAQDRFYDKYGKKAYTAKINRLRRVMGLSLLREA